jgi:type IV pilus modification protein PilV
MMNNARVRGFSMIELLVAVLVMGIGVLGITGLQMVSLQNNRGALVRAEAVQLAYDIIDRIRANPSVNYGGLALGAAPPAATNCFTNVCTEAQMAAFDQAAWKCALGNFNTNAICTGLRDGTVLPLATAQPGLPSGDGSIVTTAVVPATVPPTFIVTVTVQWQEPNQPNVTSLSIVSQG